ncbi:hypothetical protein AHF37_02060 [Paragonimus kellicotti]|nr:hypothetical protein AHF37_02060 [Paragonimus kellicotti]
MFPAESKTLADSSKENIPFRAPSRLTNRNVAAKTPVEPFGDAAKPTAPVVRTTNNVGFTNLPNQIHRKAVSRGFSLNLLITGFPGLGKSSFINALFCSDIYNKENPVSSSGSFSRFSWGICMLLYVEFPLQCNFCEFHICLILLNEKRSLATVKKVDQVTHHSTDRK